MEKVRIGVVGGRRGSTMINYCNDSPHARVVAICDRDVELLNEHKKSRAGQGIAFFDNFEDFVKHDMDVVVLANYATEHAPYAIRALREGKHVFSEVLPVETMREAVELVEAVEETGKVYGYAENYCYMPAPAEMTRLYREGVLGEFEYGEGEYVHNCESLWPSITYGERDHWRNNMYSTFYCTHSLGPILHATGLRPVSVTGFESTMNERNLRVGAKGGQFGIEMVTLENGGIVKSIHGGLYKGSIWYSMYGSLGRIECAREDAQSDHIARVYLNIDRESGKYDTGELKTYLPERPQDELARPFGHGSSDFYAMYNFIEHILGNPEADIVDVYEALDMFLPGMFAYRSVLAGGIPMEIPNLRDKSIRDKWRHDTACVTPEKAGDMLLQTAVGGTPDIPESVYDEMKRKYALELEEERKNRV